MNFPIFSNRIFRNLPDPIVKSVGLRDFEHEVLQSDRPVLVDFWGEGCMPCRVIAPIVEKFAIDHANEVKVVKVNITKEQELGQYFQIEAVPTLIMFKNGKGVKAVGLVKRDVLEQMLAA